MEEEDEGASMNPNLEHIWYRQHDGYLQDQMACLVHCRSWLTI